MPGKSLTDWAWADKATEKRTQKIDAGWISISFSRLRENDHISTTRPLAENVGGFFYAKEREKIKNYSIIYADPPWRYAQKGLQGAAERHYPTMTIDELCALPVADLAARDSALFLWATFPQPRLCGSLRNGALPIKAWLLSGWKRTKKRIAGFTGWAFGRGGTQKSACWLPGATPNGRRRISISLSFLLLPFCTDP